ncbi:CPBP family intramembrane metalloprotease [Parvularcula sp. ZS-1/3]|uniref:CPBP family intramembrane metalloprotease n=1 Tax=Parvularcula mediterranea TaxID=2732508 RepID=A0A7Y3W3R0_9PROT|nr:CPBP family intramembrane glutamic endopeptidase [Parvularcula mediterranea]NNU14723.1 CPBP family intramembrane metalloprotease [Parvularcula mediterranea]
MFQRLVQSLALGIFVGLAGAIGFLLAKGEVSTDLLRPMLTTAGVIALGAFLVSLAYLSFVKKDEEEAGKPSPVSIVLGSMVGFVAMGTIGWLAAHEIAVPIPELLRFDPLAPVMGVAAALPLIAFLHFIMTSRAERVRAFRDRQVTLFTERGFDVGWVSVALISLGAGISEEILFRGALQSLATEHLGLLAGLVLPSILFGIVHGANGIYILITGVMGVYFAGLMVWTGNLLVPITAHTVYDIYALGVTVAAVRARQRLAAA